MMLSDVTEFLYHTAEDLRIHCVASYWPLYFSSKNFLADFGQENFVDILWKLLKVSVHYDIFCHLSCVVCKRFNSELDTICRKCFLSETTKNITRPNNWNNYYSNDEYNIENVHSLSKQKVQVRGNFNPWHNDYVMRHSPIF